MKSIISKMTCGALLMAATGMLWSCAEDDLRAPGSNVADDVQLVLRLALPQGHEGSEDSDQGETRANPDPFMTPTANECKINSLRFIAFGDNGAVVNQPLTLPADMKVPVADATTAQYDLKGMKPGDYSVYVIANIETPDILKVANEGELKNIILDYTNSLPKAGEIPMVYESGSTVRIPKAGEGVGEEAVKMTCTMKMAAVKVRYNIIFDKEANQETKDIFGDNGLRITNIKVSNVATKAYLVENATADQLTGKRDLATVNALYYTAYSENKSNATVSDRNVIGVSGTGASTLAGTAYTGKWVYQGTIYLPERYVNSNPTKMEIDAVVVGKDGTDSSVKCKYAFSLAATNDDKDATSMPRDAYYEVIAKVKSLGDAELATNVVLKQWSETVVNADMVHTYLTLDKTNASVTSLQKDYIYYTTDGDGGAKFECVDTYNTQPFIISTIIKNNGQTGFEFSVNPAISIMNLPADKREGDATCYITAGNIKKKITVHYNISPFFDIDPLDTKIVYHQTDETQRTKTYTFSTNLGGVLICSDGGSYTSPLISLSTPGYTYTNTIGNSKLKVTIKYSDNTHSKGTIEVTATSDPGTTSVHYFDAYPVDYSSLTTQEQPNFKRDLSVTVQPELKDYRIYFRAINDYMSYSNGATRFEWLPGSPDNFPTEGGANNWRDWWRGNGEDHAEKAEASHLIYIWTQIGETEGLAEKTDQWLFSDTFGDVASLQNRMTGDDTNTGWYYKDLAVDAMVLHYHDKDNNWHYHVNNHDKAPEPGTTLMIFHNGQNIAQGYNLHRVTHHLDAGIPLFNYEDNEGWILYDPTTAPYYKIYDDKPIIEDVTYTIWTDTSVTGWYITYGACNQYGTDKFTMYRNYVTPAGTKTVNGKTYNCYSITYKAPRGEYAKDVIFKFESGHEVKLFNGRQYPNNTGTFSNGQWTPGEPR